MTTSNSQTVLKSSVILAPVTALEFLRDDYLLTGEGPVLSIYCLQELFKQYASLSVLHNYRIHGIRLKPQRNADSDFTVTELTELVVFGGKAVRLIHFRPNEVKLEVAGPLLELQDWALDVSWLSEETRPLLGVCLAHNAVVLLEVQSGNVLSLCCCVDTCILYSALLIGSTWETSVVVGGTVFNQLVLWRPGRSRPDGRSQVERRLLGHSGVIFSLCYLKSAGWLASASDDRSVRVWRVGQLGADGGCGEESPTCLRVLYGHQARVFCVRLTSKCVLTAGEDGTCLLWEWSGEGKVGRTLKGQRSGGIRALAVSNNVGWVATGGADGGIRLWGISENNERGTDKKDEASQIDLGFSGQGCPKVVRSLGGCHDVLVSTDQGEIVLLQGGSWKPVWNGGVEFQSYSVMDVAHTHSHEWVCAVGNLTGGIQVFAVHQPISAIVLQAGKGKVQSLQWVECGGSLCLLASGFEGLVYRWMIEIHDVSKELVIHADKLQPFLLPPCAKRWLTAVVLLPNALWLCGDRRGSLLLYQDVEKADENKDGVLDIKNRQPDGSDVVVPLCPVSTLLGVHGKQGVTSVCEHRGVCYSTGRDGCVRVLTVTKESVYVQRIHRASKGMEWLEKVFFQAYHAPENQKEKRITAEQTECEGVLEVPFVMAGFHSVEFVLWDPLRREKLFSVPCGGGHRSWAYIPPNRSQSWTQTLEQGTLIFIKQGAVMASRPVTSTALAVTGHIIKEGFQGRGQSCVFHLGSISNSRVSSEIWEVLVTGGDDTTVTVLAVEPKRNSLHVLNVLADHISNVRTVTAVRTEDKTTSFSTLLFSAGGRAQLQCYQLLIGLDEQMNKPVCQVTQFAGHRLDEQWERRKNRHKTVKMDPETRYMSMTVVHDGVGEVLLALACSDGAVRLFTVSVDLRKIELLWESFYHQRCVLSVATYSFPDPEGNQHVLLFSGATDGAVALWDLTTVLDSKSRDSWHGPAAPCFSIPVHQSGVNTLVVSKCPGAEQMGTDILTVASGGDDGLLSVMEIRVQFHGEAVFTELVSHHTVTLAHAAPLTGLTRLKPRLLVSTSPDQRVCVWRISKDGLQHQTTTFSHTADAAGLCAWKRVRPESEDETYVVVCGHGLQLLTLSEHVKNAQREEEEKKVVFADHSVKS